MGMTNKELYICACNYAIQQIIKTGSNQLTIIDSDEMIDVPWEEVLFWLKEESCGEQMDFPSTFDEFAKDYGFKDKDEVYTNGSELIPVFRVKQWLEHIATTKNDLGIDKTFYEQMVEYCNEHFLVLVEKDVWEDAKKALTTKSDLEVDCISRAEAIRVASGYCHPSNVAKELAKLPSVTPQEPKTGHWIKYGIPRCGEQHYKCTNCDEYFNFGLYSDYYKKAFKYCPNCGAKMADRSEEDGNDD